MGYCNYCGWGRRVPLGHADKVTATHAALHRQQYEVIVKYFGKVGHSVWKLLHNGHPADWMLHDE